MWLNTLLLALREIRRNLLRSFLTMLGIVIGVSAVITMVTLGNGATRSVQAQIASLGSNLLMVMPGQRLGPGGGGGPPFAAADVEAIASQIGGVRLVAPEVRSSATLVANGRNWSAQVTGSTQNWFSVANWTIASGRGFEPDEERVGAAVCVIGATVRKELFGGADPIGEQVRVKKFSCTVVGLLGGKGQGAMGNDQDNLLVLPLATMQRRVVGHTRINTILVSMNESADTDRLKASLEQLMRERRKLADADDDTVNAAWLKRFTVAGEASQAAAPPRETMNSATRRRGGGGSAGRSPGRARQQADGQDRCQPRHGLVGGGGTPRPAITPKNLSAWRNSESVRDEHGVMSIPSPFQVRFCEDQERLRSGHRPIVLTPPMRAIIARPKRLP